MCNNATAMRQLGQACTVHSPTGEEVRDREQPVLNLAAALTKESRCLIADIHIHVSTNFNENMIVFHFGILMKQKCPEHPSTCSRAKFPETVSWIDEPVD